MFIQRIKILEKKRQKDQNDSEKEFYLRVFVDSGGCSGFQYNFEIVNDDQLEKDKDYIYTRNGIKIIIDDITMDMINMSTIDYKVEMIRSSFEIIGNPNAELACSCGTSF